MVLSFNRTANRRLLSAHLFRNNLKSAITGVLKGQLENEASWYFGR